MVKQYKNPPLVEALCEIHFEEFKWDITYPADFYNKIKVEFPQKKTIEVQDVQVVVSGSGIGLNSNSTFNRPVLHCSNEDGNISIQFTESTLVISVSNPYMGWENFRTLIENMYKHYENVVDGDVFIKRITLSYNNIFDTGKKHSYENIREYSNLYPNIPVNEKVQSATAIQILIESPSQDNKSVLVVQQGTLKSTKNIKAPIALNLKYVCISPKEVNISNWLDEAHDAIQTTFESTVTNLLKEKF